MYSILVRRQAQSLRSLYYEQVGLANSQLDINRGTTLSTRATQLAMIHPLTGLEWPDALSSVQSIGLVAVTTVCSMLDVSRKQLMLVSPYAASHPYIAATATSHSLECSACSTAIREATSAAR